MQFTSEQLQALEIGEAVPVVVGQTKCVVIRQDVYERVKLATDDWTEDELSLLAAQTFEDADAAGPIE